jgi:hypothetical protein
MFAKQNQHQMFAYEILPLIFHNETMDFFSYLRKDGIKFLKFWWDRAGVNMDESLRSTSEGIDFEIRTVPDGREMVLVTLPAPKKAPEAYYLAMVERPKKRSFFPWRNLGRVFALSRSVDEHGTPNTVIAELTKTARYVEVKKGPQPSMTLFYKSVCDMLEDKKKKK